MPESRFELRTARRTSLRRQTGSGRTRRMTFRGDLYIGRIITAGTSIISIPADFRTCRRLRLVML